MIRDLRRLMLLCDLAELRTVAAVAEHRQVTGSAVSQQLRSLEQEVDAVLFRRDGRTLRLTPSGEVLVDHARRVLATIDGALAAVAATSDRATGRVTVAGFETSIPTLAAPLVQRLGTSAPDVHVRVLQADGAAAVRALRHGEIDLALITHLRPAPRPSLGGLVWRDLFHDPLVLLAPPRLHHRIRTFGLPVVADGPWIAGPPDSVLTAALSHVGDTAGFVPQVKHRVEGAPNMCQLAGHGGGLAVVPRMSVPAALEGSIVARLELGGLDVGAVHRDSATGHRALAVTLRELQRLVRDLQGSAEPGAVSVSAS